MSILILISYIIPHPIYPYVMSVTSLKLHELVIAHIVGLPPPRLLPILLGLSLPAINMMGEKNTDDFLGPYKYPVMGLTLLACLIVVAVIVQYIRGEMKRILAENDNGQSNSTKYVKPTATQPVIVDV